MFSPFRATGARRSRRRLRRTSQRTARWQSVEQLEARRLLSGNQLGESLAGNDTAQVISQHRSPTDRSGSQRLRLLEMDDRVLPLETCPGLDSRLCMGEREAGGSPVRFNLLRALAAEQALSNQTSLAVTAAFGSGFRGSFGNVSFGNGFGSLQLPFVP